MKIVETIAAELKIQTWQVEAVIRLIDFGAFVDIGVHQDGLVHISQMSASKFVKHPLDVVSVGDIVEVKVLSVDMDRKRIALTMKLDETVQRPDRRKEPPASSPHRPGDTGRLQAAPKKTKDGGLDMSALLKKWS